MARVLVESVRNVQVQVDTGEHSWIADEPPEVGDGEGPGPYDMLLGAFGSCMTLLLYARRKEWPLDGVAVDIQHDRIHADDASNVEQPGGMVERFQIELLLRGDLDEDQVERLRDISTRCPMRKTLAGSHVFDESVRLAV